MTRTWLLAATVLAGVIVGPAEAAPTAPQLRTMVLERTTAGPASFTFVVDAQLSDQDPQGFIGLVSARVDRGRVVEAAAVAAHAFYWDHGVRADAGDQVVEVCQPVGGCIVNRTLAYQTHTESADEGGTSVHNRLYVVVEGPGEVRFSGRGWVLRTRALDHRWLASRDAEVSGVLTGTTGVQHFESASLPGGVGGSIAVGAPPCSQAGSGLTPRGVGTATLRGGTHEPSLTCPANAGRPYVTATAPAEADWRLTGPVVGESTMANVPLLVLDLPARP